MEIGSFSDKKSEEASRGLSAAYCCMWAECTKIRTSQSF